MTRDVILLALAALAVIGLVVALVWWPCRLVRGLNPPDDEDEIHWT